MDPQFPQGTVSGGVSAAEKTTEGVSDTTNAGTGDAEAAVSVLENVKILANESPLVDDTNNKLTVIDNKEKGAVAPLYLTRSDSDMAQDKLNTCCGVCLEG